MNPDEAKRRRTGGMIAIIVVAALTRVVPRIPNFTSAAPGAFHAIVSQTAGLTSLMGG